MIASKDKEVEMELAKWDETEDWVREQAEPIGLEESFEMCLMILSFPLADYA